MPPHPGGGATTTTPDRPVFPDPQTCRAAIETFVQLARLAMVASEVDGQAYTGLRRDLTQLAQEAGRRRPRPPRRSGVTRLPQLGLGP